MRRKMTIFHWYEEFDRLDRENDELLVHSVKSTYMFHVILTLIAHNQDPCFTKHLEYCTSSGSIDGKLFHTLDRGYGVTMKYAITTTNVPLQ